MEPTRTSKNPLFEELRHLSPRVTGGLVRMRQETYRDNKVAAKYKILTALAISIAIRCEPCVQAYVQMARDHGVSQDEFIEFLEVAMTMQGCPGEEWALKAFAAFKTHGNNRQSEAAGTCCNH